MRNAFKALSWSFFYFYSILETSITVVLRAYQLWLHIQTNTVENSWNLCNMVNLNYFQGHSMLCESDEWEVGLRDTVLYVSKMLTLPLLNGTSEIPSWKKKSLCPTNYYFLKSLSLRTKILLGEKITTSFLDANIWQALVKLNYWNCLLSGEQLTILFFFFP